MQMPRFIIALIAAQVVCALVFLGDVLTDISDSPFEIWQFVPEGLASLALLVGIGFEVFYLVHLLRRKASLERSIGLASSELQTIIDSHFDDWNLTASERDVAGLMVKGLSIAEIASVRGTAEGTIKAHLNAIYRKSNARNRAEVLSNIMETLMGRPLLTSDKG
jgi:DNA-binding CsgD family transcriptional regulator